MNLYGTFHAKHTNNAECDIISFGVGIDRHFKR